MCHDVYFSLLYITELYKYL